MSSKFLSTALLLLLVTSFAQTTLAQSDKPRVQLRGTVSDTNSETLPGASVGIEVNGRVFTATVTDQKGEFNVSLVPGEYTIRALANGFAELLQTVQISLVTPGPVYLILQPVAATATVTITDTAGYGVLSSISSATKTLTPLRDVPQSISVITREQLSDQSMSSVADVVAYVPGITAHQGENNRDQLVIRGNSTSADFFLNGVRDDVQYYRDMYNVDRVEVLKGPNSMLFGRGGGGGVINRVSKEAGGYKVRELTFQGGSSGNKRASGDFDQPLSDKLALRLNGLYENSNSFRQFVNLRRYGLNPALTWTPGSKTAINVNYERFQDKRTADRGIPSYHLRPVDVPLSTFFGDPDHSLVHADINLLSTSITHQVGRFDIRDRTQFGDYARGYQNFVPGAVTANKSQVAISAYNNATKRKNIFNQTDVNFSASTRRVKHNVLMGTEVGRQLTDNFRNTGYFNNTATSIFVPLDNPTVTTPVTFRQSGTDADNHVETNLGAAYLQDQVAISSKFQVVTGVRFDYFDLQFHNNRNNQELRRIDRLVSPRFGVVFKPQSHLSLYLNYGVAYLPGSGDQFSSLTSITQQIKPEKFSNYEAGAKWDVRRNLALTAAIYRQDRTNTRATDPNDPTRIVQTGSQRTNGFEVGMNGNVTRKWGMAGGYSFQNAFITSATASAAQGALVAQVPHHNFSLWNNYRVFSRLGVGVGLIHRSDMYAAIDDTVVLPGYTRADAAAFFYINEKWRLQLNVQNLLDKKYYLNADNNNNISPGSPRATRLSLVAHF